MNDRNKHKVTGQMNHQTADPKAYASVFLFFPTAHFFNSIYQRTNGTLDLAPTAQANTQAKSKEPFFCPRTKDRLAYENLYQKYGL